MFRNSRNETTTLHWHQGKLTSGEILEAPTASLSEKHHSTSGILQQNHVKLKSNVVCYVAWHINKVLSFVSLGLYSYPSHNTKQNVDALNHWRGYKRADVGKRIYVTWATRLGSVTSYGPPYRAFLALSSRYPLCPLRTLQAPTTNACYSQYGRGAAIFFSGGFSFQDLFVWPMTLSLVYMKVQLDEQSYGLTIRRQNKATTVSERCCVYSSSVGGIPTSFGV